MILLKQYLYGIGQTKRKRAQSFLYNLNSLRTLLINIGLNLILMILQNYVQMVLKEFFSSIGSKAFHNSNTMLQESKRKNFMTRRKLRPNSQKQFLFQTLRWQLQELNTVRFLSGTDHLLLKVLENKTKKD